MADMSEKNPMGFLVGLKNDTVQRFGLGLDGLGQLFSMGLWVAFVIGHWDLFLTFLNVLMLLKMGAMW